MKLFSAITLCMIATSSIAAGNPTYDGKDIYHTNATLADLSSETTRLNEYNFGNSVAIQGLSARADNTDLDQIRQDQVSDALATRLNGLYTDTAGLSQQTRQAYQEARDARRQADRASKGASIALAVAGQQMCTRVECGGQVSLSGSTMNGSQAVALGIGAPINDRWFVNGAFAQSGGVSGGVVSTTYSFGR